MAQAFVHETSIVESDVEIGEGTKVWLFCHILPGARIGCGSQLGQNVFVGRDVKIGNNVKIQNNVSVYEGVEIADDVFCGPSMVFTNVINPRSHVSRKDEFKKTVVQKGVSIGANATVVCGVTLGQYSFIGAGAVVTNDVPDFALIVGVPGKQVGWMCRCGVRLALKDDCCTCNDCGTRYQCVGEKTLNFAMC